MAAPLWAVEYDLPTNAERFEQVITDPGRYSVPLGVWTADDGLYSRVVEGRIVQESWHIPGASSASQIITPLLAQIADSHEILVDCISRACGGFDFRFAIEVLPAPSIYVDLTSYRFVTARSRGDDNGFVTFLASLHKGTGYLQVVHALPRQASLPPASAPPRMNAPNTQRSAHTERQPSSLIDRLARSGRAVLEGLAFDSGSSRLANDTIPSLDHLAGFLAENPTARIALVGHTDATGSLAANRAISRKRAASVMAYLIDRKNVDPARLEADGVGYLAPIASNRTEDGRSANRRVEVVVIPDD